MSFLKSKKEKAGDEFKARTTESMLCQEENVDFYSLNEREGRPSKELELTPEMAEDIFNFAVTQMTLEQIATGIGMTTTQFTALRKKYPNLTKMIERARTTMVRGIANAMMKKGANGNVQAMKFILERKAGWTLKQQIELSGKDGQPIQQNIAEMSLDEAQQLYQQMIACPQDES